MSKPSIFSRSYDRRMKRRRLNIILFLLLLLCIAIFGGRYLLKINNINIFSSSGSKSDTKKDGNINSDTNKGDKVGENNVTSDPSTTTKEYTYTLKNNKIIKIEYTENGADKQIKEFKNENLDSIEYDISPDKKRALFVDKADSSLIVLNSDGNFIDITKQSVNYSKKRSLTRKVLENDSNYVWNGKPHFTSDGNIVYLSDMPNSKSGYLLTIWSTTPEEGAAHVKVGKASRDISVHNFEGFDEVGRLKLNTPDGTIYISKDGYKVEKE